MPRVATPPLVLHAVVWMLSASPAWAGDVPPDQRPYVHPLAQAGRALAQHQGSPPTAEFLASVRVHTLTTIDEQGVETVVSEVVPSESGRLEDAAPAREPTIPSTPWMSPEVSAIVVSPFAAKPTTVDVWLRLRSTEWNPGVDAVQARRRALVEGRIQTVADERRVRAEAVQAREFAGQAAIEGLLQELERAGGEIVETIPSSAQVRAVVPVTALYRYARDRRIAALELHHETSTEAGQLRNIEGTPLSGFDLSDLLQTYQFYYATTLGGTTNFYGSDTLGLIEGGGASVFRAHPGFDDVNHVDRVRNCSRSVFFTCLNNNPSVGDDHATAVATVMVGDVTRGQDAEVTYGNQRVDRSGVARRASLFSMGTIQSWVESQMTNPANGVLLANNSWLEGSKDVALLTDPTCLGQTSWARTFNSIFESGVAMFKSAGNSGHDEDNLCTATSPASAIGAFPVAAYQVIGGAEELYSLSSRGGVPKEGGGRSIIAIATPSHFAFPYPHYDRPVADSDGGNQAPWWVAQGQEYFYGADWVDSSVVIPNSFCCTSSAAAAASGAAAVYADWYRTARGNAIEEPGLLYANLLLMGDGYTGEGVDNPRYGRYDNLWGAGKLRLRRFDSVGLDGPAAFDDGYVCVHSGDYVTVPITAALASQVDVLKAVTWWYDRRHQEGITNGDGIAHDELKLRLQSKSATSSVWFDVEVDDSTDNKQRVALDPGDYLTTQWRLRIDAVDVTADAECGNDAMLVYYAWMFEDSAREASENLGSVRTEL